MREKSCGEPHDLGHDTLSRWNNPTTCMVSRSGAGIAGTRARKKSSVCASGASSGSCADQRSDVRTWSHSSSITVMWKLDGGSKVNALPKAVWRTASWKMDSAAGGEAQQGDAEVWQAEEHLSLHPHTPFERQRRPCWPRDRLDRKRHIISLSPIGVTISIPMRRAGGRFPDAGVAVSGSSPCYRKAARTWIGRNDPRST